MGRFAELQEMMQQAILADDCIIADHNIRVQKRPLAHLYPGRDHATGRDRHILCNHGFRMDMGSILNPQADMWRTHKEGQNFRKGQIGIRGQKQRYLDSALQRRVNNDCRRTTTYQL